MPGPKVPTTIDVHIGKRLKRLRRDRELSQTALGRAANVSFQQIQKYERGCNRISVGRLWDFCKLLDVSPTYFFEGLGGYTDHDERSADLIPMSAG